MWAGNKLFHLKGYKRRISSASIWNLFPAIFSEVILLLGWLLKGIYKKFSSCFRQAELEHEGWWLWEEDVKKGILGQFLQEERDKNSRSMTRLTPLRMWKKPKDGEELLEMEERGEVEQGEDAGGPSRECIGEAFNHLNSGFSYANPKVGTFFTREGADGGYMVPKGSEPPLVFYNAGQLMSFTFFQGMRLPFPPLLPLVYDSMVTLSSSPTLQHLYHRRPALESILKEHLEDVHTTMAIDVVEGTQEVELFEGGGSVSVNQANYSEYVNRVNTFLNQNNKTQVEAMALGLTTYIPSWILQECGPAIIQVG